MCSCRGVRRSGIGTRCRRTRGVGDDRRDLRVDRVELLRRTRARGRQTRAPEWLDRVARFPVVDLVLRAVAGVAHPLGVRAGAVGAALEQGRSASRPGARDRLRGRLVDRDHIVAVDRDPGDAVGPRALGHVGVAGGVVERHLGGVHVVLADVDHRQIPDRGHVDPLVEGAVVDRAIAEEADADPVAFQQLEAVAGAGRLQDVRSDDAGGAHQADFGREEVHAAAAAARDAGRLAEELGHHLAGRHALGQRVAVAAVGAEDDVVLAQVGADADRDRLLADVGVAGAGDVPLRVGAGQSLFHPADAEHLAIEPERLLGRQVSCRGTHAVSCRFWSSPVQ